MVEETHSVNQKKRSEKIKFNQKKMVYHLLRIRAEKLRKLIKSIPAPSPDILFRSIEEQIEVKSFFERKIP